MSGGAYTAGLPGTFATLWFDRNMQRWAEPFGDTLRRMTRSPVAFPGAPISAFLGFASAATRTEDTGSPRPSGEYINPVFRETGFLGNESGPTFIGPNRARCIVLASRAQFNASAAGCTLGPSPNPDPRAPFSNYARWANHPYVTRADMLGRPASLAQHGWYDVNDQTAVGLVNLRWHGNSVAERMPEAIRALRPDTLWGVALSFMGWSAGDGLAAHHLSQLAGPLAGVLEPLRLATAALAVARRALREASRWPAKSYQNPAYLLIRLFQKLWAGRAVEAQRGTMGAWYQLGWSPDLEAAVFDILARAAYGAPIALGVILPETVLPGPNPAGAPLAMGIQPLQTNLPLAPPPVIPYADPELADKSVRADEPTLQQLLFEPSLYTLIQSYGPAAEKQYIVSLNERLYGPIEDA